MCESPRASSTPEYVQRTCIGEPHEGTDPLMLGLRTCPGHGTVGARSGVTLVRRVQSHIALTGQQRQGVTRYGPPISSSDACAVYVVCECCLHMVPHGVLPKQHVMQGHVCAHHTHTSLLFSQNQWWHGYGTNTPCGVSAHHPRTSSH